MTQLSKPFTDVEIIKAVGIKLAEMRTEARESERDCLLSSRPDCRARSVS